MITLFKFRWLAAIWLAVSLLAGAGASPASAAATTCPAAPNEGDVDTFYFDTFFQPACSSGLKSSNGAISVTNHLAKNNTISFAVAGGATNSGVARCIGGGCGTTADQYFTQTAQIACDTSLGNCGVNLSFSISNDTFISAWSFEVAQGTTSLPIINVASSLYGQPQPVPPTISSVSPNTGNPAGGTIVVITGTGFTGASIVTFGTNAPSFVVVSDTQITATTPPHAGGAVAVSVTTTPGSSQTLNSGFTYDINSLAFSRPLDQTYSPGGTFPVVATGVSGGGAVSLSSGTTLVCTVSGSTVTTLDGGTCTITATQGRVTVSQSFFIHAHPQTITTFTPPPATDFSAGPVTLLAVSDSGLPVAV